MTELKNWKNCNCILLDRYKQIHSVGVEAGELRKEFAVRRVMIKNSFSEEQIKQILDEARQDFQPEDSADMNGEQPD